jgi:multisite-specific tRNA:(cytosine-C5)-methyltransferase
MVLPLWRSLHSVNLMLPKEERRAMLLRIFNDDTPLINITQKRADTNTPSSATPAAASIEAEEEAVKHENEVLGQDEQEQVESRETWQKAGDEEDRFNTTV